MKTRYLVHPLVHEIWKFMPHDPPSRGDIVMVDDKRCRVVRAKVSWEGLRWTLIGSIVVEDA